MGDQELRREYDRLSEVYDRDRVDAFFESGLDRLEGLLSPYRERILEVGCGTGRYLAGLRGRGLEVVGVDFSPKMCEVARGRLTGDSADPADVVRCADVEEELGFEGTFRAIVIMDSWETFPAPRRVLENARAALEPEGRLFIFTPRALARPLIVTLETLGIKKLKPAFVYLNSSPRKVRRLAEGLFAIERHRTIFFGLESVFELVPLEGGD